MIAQGPHGRDTPNPALPADSKYSHDPAFPPWVCRNPSCKSYGKSHPNCQCGPPGTRGGDRARTGGEYPMAHGGMINHFCSEDRAHSHDCEYFADGGSVGIQPEDPATTLGNAAIEHGLLGLLKNVGRPNMVEPEKHSRVLHEARNQHEWRREPKEMKLPRTMGTRLGDHLADGDHEKAAGHMHGHPLVGSAQKGHLKPIMAQMVQPMLTQDPHPEGFRGSIDYLSSAHKGEARLDHSIQSLLSPEKHEKLPAAHSIQALKEYLDALDQNPSELLDIGGSLGHYLPGHSMQLANTAAQSINYLKSLKPMPSQHAPLDKVSKVSQADEMKYDRQLAIAQQPLLVLSHLKKGTLQPQDLMTVQTLFPGLHKTMVNKAFEQIADSMAKDQPMSYSDRMGLSLLLGQPLDSTLSSQNMQAIIQSAASQQNQQQNGGPKKASGVELKEVDKMSKLYGTSAQDRELEGKD